MDPARIARWVVALLAVGAIAPSQSPADDYGFTHAPGSPFTNTGLDAKDMIVAAMDGDAFPDLVMGDQIGGTIAIYWGNASGSFDPTPYEIGGPSNNIAVADLNGAGGLDVVGAGLTIQPHFNNGNRTFTSGTSVDVKEGDDDDCFDTNGLAAANFDGDGDVDVAVTASDNYDSCSAVRIFTNNGSGLFTMTNEPATASFVGDIVVGLFDNDDDPDLAYAGSNANDVMYQVLLGTGGANFTEQAEVETGNGDDILTADLDNDGELDLLLPGSVNVHWGNGNGTFGAGQQIDDAYLPYGFFTGDLTNDGLPDVGVLANDDEFNGLVVLLTNKGSRTFARGAVLPSPEFGYGGGVTAQLAGDARNDLILGGFDELHAFITGDPPPPPPPDGPGDTTPPPGDPPPGPPSGPLPPAPPLVTPVVPVRANQIATLPSNRKCVSRRNFKIRLRRAPAGVTVLEARVLVNGKRVAVRRGTRLTAPVDLRGLPKGKVVVTIRISLADGRTLRGRRAYRTCATKKRKGKFGRKRRGQDS